MQPELGCGPGCSKEAAQTLPWWPKPKPGSRGPVSHRPGLGYGEQPGRHLTHRDILKGDVGHIVVGAALPGIVQAEGQGTGVPALQGRKLAEGAVLDVDGAVVQLDPPNGKVPVESGESASGALPGLPLRGCQQGPSRQMRPDPHPQQLPLHSTWLAHL